MSDLVEAVDAVDAVRRTPHMIANEINTIKGQTRQVILYSSVEIGRRLVEAKEMLSHGEWMNWLKESVDYSQSTANNLMQLYREFGTDFSKFPTLGNLSYTKALALLGVPAEEREQFAQEHDVESMSARELQQAIKAKKEAEKQAKMLEAELKKIQQAAEKERREREALAERVAQLQVELADAKIAGNAEEAQKLQDALAEAQAKVKQLEKELRTKPIDVPAVVEKIPEEVERELVELRKKAAQPDSAATVKFRLQFDQLVVGFRDLLATLAEIQTADPETHTKYKGAVLGLIGKMSKTLEE